MANRRMFSIDVVGTDHFTDLRFSERLLYFYLVLYADDDGFCRAPKKVQRAYGFTADDFEGLIRAGYVISFENGPAVDVYWRTNNLIRPDRYKPTVFQTEMGSLVRENGRYSIRDPSKNPGIPTVNQTDTNGIPTANQMEPQVKLSKDSIGQDNSGEREGKVEEGQVNFHSPAAEESQIPFTPPTVSEVTAFSTEQGLAMDPEQFVNHYTANGWKVGQNPMVDWKAAVRTWARRERYYCEKPRAGNSVPVDSAGASEREGVLGNIETMEILGFDIPEGVRSEDRA